MMAQGVLPYQFEVESGELGMTGLGGLPVYLDLAHVVGLRESIGRHVRVRAGSQGWTDAQMITTVLLLNLAGGECVEDLEKLESDAGFAEILQRVETHGMQRSERRRHMRRWRKARDRSLPSVSAVRRYLASFHDSVEASKRVEGRALLPARSRALTGLSRVNADCSAFLQRHAPASTATLDMDAALIETLKKEAQFCYKKFRAYQPLNVWWAQQQLVVHSEFRDGNVPAGYEQLRVLKETLDCLPDGVESVSMRSDTAGYQWDLLRYCGEGRSERRNVSGLASLVSGMCLRLRRRGSAKRVSRSLLSVCIWCLSKMRVLGTISNLSRRMRRCCISK